MQIYHEENHPSLKDLVIKDCYICDEPLSGKIDSDHIIPDHFLPSADHKPQLPVHHDCNNAKSRNDKFAVLQIQTLCSLNPEAEADLLKFLDTAEKEKEFAHLIGKKDKVHNLRLALTLFEKTQERLDYSFNGKTITSFTNPPENVDRLNGYMRQLCKGLYIRNVAGSKPGLPSKLTWINYEHAKMRGEYDKVLQPIGDLVNKSASSRFSQEWRGRVLYFGSHIAESIDKGYIFIEFYQNVGLLAAFGVNPDLRRPSTLINS